MMNLQRRNARLPKQWLLALISVPLVLGMVSIGAIPAQAAKGPTIPPNPLATISAAVTVHTTDQDTLLLRTAPETYCEIDCYATFGNPDEWAQYNQPKIVGSYMVWRNMGDYYQKIATVTFILNPPGSGLSYEIEFTDVNGNRMDVQAITDLGVRWSFLKDLSDPTRFNFNLWINGIPLA